MAIDSTTDNWVESIVNQNRTEINTPHYSIAQQATTSIAQTDSTFDAI